MIIGNIGERIEAIADASWRGIMAIT
jgi:hypothetical protein